MSRDTTTRVLYRSLSPEDAGRLLRERIRTGEVPERHVRLAAWLGYGPALAAAEPKCPDADEFGDRQRFRACRASASASLGQPARRAIAGLLLSRLKERGEVSQDDDGGWHWRAACESLRLLLSLGASGIPASQLASAVGRHIHAMGSLREKSVASRIVAEVLCWGPPA